MGRGSRKTGHGQWLIQTHELYGPVPCEADFSECKAAAYRGKYRHSQGPVNPNNPGAADYRHDLPAIQNTPGRHYSSKSDNDKYYFFTFKPELQVPGGVCTEIEVQVIGGGSH